MKSIYILPLIVLCYLVNIVSSKSLESKSNCQTNYADIMFALDESGSIKAPNFKIMKDFTKDIIKHFPIGSENVRVGVLTFSYSVKYQFNLNSYFNKEEIFRKIDKIRYGKGGTMTHLALNSLRVRSFTNKYGDRKNVQNIAILMTDGISNKPSRTKIAAEKLRETGAMVFAIGIRNSKKSEIENIASKPSSEFTFSVEEFGALKNIVNKLVSRTCLYIPCSTHPCKNGAACANKGTDFHCECRPGYRGKDCSIVDPCSSNPCKNGGQCTNKGDKFECECVPGYRGEDCSMVDPCSSNPCQNGGKCTNKGDKFECECVPGYRGEDCSIVDPCSSNPCKNGGKCTNKGDKFECECVPGYRGEDCSIVDPCSSNPCQNEGKCTNKGDKFECECVPGYRGKDCSIVDPCSSNPCQNEGKCTNKGDKFECECVPGYRGEDCSIVDPCSSNPCKNGGKCTNKGDKFECECVPGYRGEDCSIVDPCSSNPCKNGGQCTNKGDKFECECVPGYRGEDCSIVDPCNSNPCKNGGKCTNKGDKFECECVPGYRGEDCSIVDPCSSNPCNNGGKCTNKGDKFECECVPGYRGEDCSIVDPCSSNPCKNGGKCTNKGDKFECECVPGYRGEDCSIVDPCSSNPCKNGGKCTKKGDKFECECVPGYRGEDCSIVDPCSSNPCQNEGKCTNKGDKFECECVPGYRGDDCSIVDPCSSNPCKNGGQCTNKGDKFECECVPGYRGEDCSIVDPCSSNPCQNEGKCTNKGDKFECECVPGYRGDDCSIVDPCSSNPCKNGGQCTNKGDKFECECVPGYRGEDCSIVDPCSSNPCRNEGKCTNKGDKFECECVPGYRGDDCSIVDPCSSNPCQNEGKCTNKGDKFECECVPGYRGEDCSIVDPCSSNPCKNGGQCTNKGDKFECECVPGYRGEDCSIVDPCSSNPCKNGGKCTNKGDKFECECVPGYRGEDCSIVDPCSSDPCQNGATCTNNGNKFECQCPPEYKGNDCSIERPPCICSTSGDSNYKTFDGQMIHFIGTCSYTMTASKPGYNSTSFAVEVQSIKKDSKGLFNRIVDVKLPTNTIRILPFSGILVNSVKRSLPIIDNKEFSAYFSVGSVTLTTDWGLIVRFDRTHQVSVTLPPSFTNKVTGICGDCNDKKDDYRTKSGEPLSHNPEDFERLGESYRVSDNNNSACYTKKVIQNCSESHECDIFKSPVFEECAKKLGKDRIDEIQEACQVDTCSYAHNEVNKKMSFCRVMEVFAKECRNAGAEIEWTTSKCSQFCPNNQEYKSKVLTCQPSCTNKSPDCSTYTEGCVCKPGFILSGEECIPESKCGCLKENFYMTLGEEIYSHDCLTKTVCHKGGAMESIQMPGCSLNKHCALKDGEYGCICGKDYTLYKGKCEKLGLDKFIRVQSAWFNKESYYSYSTSHPNLCLETCLQHDRCKSANYDNEKEICELFRTTAAEKPLNRTDCPAKDYYQLKESKNIIKGASIRGCHRLVSATGVANEECEKECKKKRCEAFEYSEETKSCNILLPADKDDFDLVGNEHWAFYN
ncbi:neurogenic locus notch homolog protein 1 isoform X6 [Octopus sinensis]|uniref:Neurogenic locus notch homolog protein 1 isoform X6 n=1 Tax=Octopus sinensis TaxID=2607531 RepID=A0A7E6ENA2_9MOLL|nr:neurogenic locus notch homolog protein 1 isoform X6 [Octopus sinensis]